MVAGEGRRERIEIGSNHAQVAFRKPGGKAGAAHGDNLVVAVSSTIVDGMLE